MTLGNYIHTLVVCNDKLQGITIWEMVDKFIDKLLEGIKTSLPYSNLILNMGLALKQEYGCCQLPPIEVHLFGDNPLGWPEFVSNFRNRIHEKVSFNSSTRLECSLTTWKGEAEKSVLSIFSATALKSLKWDIGNPVLLSHLKMTPIFDQHQVDASDKIELKNYHQQVVITNTWLW